MIIKTPRQNEYQHDWNKNNFQENNNEKKNKRDKKTSFHRQMISK